MQVTGLGLQVKKKLEAGVKKSQLAELQELSVLLSLFSVSSVVNIKEEQRHKIRGSR